MIESLQNERIKHLIRLSTDNHFRRKSGLFIVEGTQENKRALDNAFEAIEFFIQPELFSGDFLKGNITEVSAKVYEKIAYRGSVEGIVGIYKTSQKTLASYKLPGNGTAIIAEAIEKPGNLGAILRSCEAFGIDAVIIADARTDFFNPNVIRSSVGCLFGMNVFAADNAEVWNFLQQNGTQLYSTFMDEAAASLAEVGLSGKSAIIFGTEHSGLSDFWLGKGQNILIPMAGTIDSLNLSNAVAITCYEVLRQKLNTIQ